MASDCLFCRIAGADVPAYIVFEDEVSLAFLDTRPLFPGHTLLIPRRHVVTLADIPADLLGPLFGNVQVLCRAVEQAMNAEGTFVAVNNKVSQSVAHFHVHVVPRKPKDGLRGFFWPRGKYETEQSAETVQAAIRDAISSNRR